MTRVFLASVFLCAPAFAADLATGDAIRAAISGNTVQGSMSATGAYTEFYAADGVIKGADYAGMWSIEGDTMCFVYGETPPDCWNARVVGDKITWVKDGADLGTGTILPGNPNSF